LNANSVRQQWPRLALPQDSPSFSQPQSFLREASALIPRIDKDQRSSAAANIAGQQARIGDH
jgi:hypothetical protein